MCRRRPSPAASVVEQDGHTIGDTRWRWWQLQVPWAAASPSHFDGACGDWHNARYRCAAIEHGERAAPADRLQVLAEPRLEIRDADALHDHILVTNGHDICHGRRPARSEERRVGKE